MCEKETKYFTEEDLENIKINSKSNRILNYIPKKPYWTNCRLISKESGLAINTARMYVNKHKEHIITRKVANKTFFQLKESE